MVEPVPSHHRERRAGGRVSRIAGLVAGLAVINVAGVCAHVGDRAASTSTIETQATLRIEVAAWRTTWIVGWANRHRHRDGGQTRQDRYPVGPIESQRKARAGLAGERNEAAGCGNQGGTPLRWRLKDGRPGPRPRGTWPSYVALDDPADARPSNSCHIAPFAVSIDHNGAIVIHGQARRPHQAERRVGAGLLAVAPEARGLTDA
jgi:hypothetical protein